METDNFKTIIIDSKYKLNQDSNIYSFEYQLPEEIVINKYIKLAFGFIPNDQYHIPYSADFKLVLEYVIPGPALYFIFIEKGYYTIESLRTKLET